MKDRSVNPEALTIDPRMSRARREDVVTKKRWIFREFQAIEQGIAGVSDTRSQQSKGWLRNREFGSKSNRHDTPPTFLSICGRRFYASSTLRKLVDPLHPLAVRSSPREKEKQAGKAFVRTFLGHLLPLHRAYHRYPSLHLIPYHCLCLVQSRRERRRYQ